ncbi:MAG: type II CRISPR-associated endonuclease Cas1 [Lachnospiraceae bacterium]|nr:type II CRISPR-associated endonuclease Cas1 [Lachnospiraceae bacterium]
MAYRIVMIESEASLALKLNNLIVNKGEGDIWIPLDDISVIVIDNLCISLTARMLSVLAEKNIAVFLTNQEHLPIGYFSSYDNHSRAFKVIGHQISKDKSFYDSFWRQIVVSKIANQRKALRLIGKGDLVDKQLNDLSINVTDGDLTNREAHAAKLYFNTMMECSFSRGNEDILLNSGLDYAYAIIRAFIARCCVGYGLNTQIGIHHKNEYNRFNLVDDLIEPIRPFADVFVYKMMLGADYFTREHRRSIVNILNHKVNYGLRDMYMCNMLEEYVEGYAAMVSGNRESVIFPDIDEYLGEEDEI